MAWKVKGFTAKADDLIGKAVGLSINAAAAVVIICLALIVTGWSVRFAAGAWGINL